MRNLIIITVLALLSACGAQSADEQTGTPAAQTTAAPAAATTPDVSKKYTHGDVVYIVPDCIPVVVYDSSTDRSGAEGWLLVSPTAPNDLVFIKDKYISSKCPDNP